MSPVWALLLFHFWIVNPLRCFLCLYCIPHYFISFDYYLFFPHLCFYFAVSHPLPLPLSSCLGCIPPLIGLPLLRRLLRSVLCGCLQFVSSVCDFVCAFCFLFIATVPFAGYFLVHSLLSAFPAYLRVYSQLDLVWFRLSCDPGWVRSGLVNVR